MYVLTCLCVCVCVQSVLHVSVMTYSIPECLCMESGHQNENKSNQIKPTWKQPSSPSRLLFAISCTV